LSKIEELVKSRVRSLPDFPKPGILFRDISPLLRDEDAFRSCIKTIAEYYKNDGIDYVAGIESRGFIIGSALAYEMGKGFVQIRKAGKLPFETVSEPYSLEYGSQTLEIQKDAIEKGKRVLVVDDLIATGGTAEAACRLVERIGGKVAGVAFIIELSELKGREKLSEIKFISLAKY